MRLRDAVLALLLTTAGTAALGAQALPIYDDALAAGWEDWSWAAHDLDNPAPVASGTASISFEPDGWEGLFLHSTGPLGGGARPGPPPRRGAGGAGALLISIHLGGTTIGQTALAPFVAGGAVPAGSWAEAVVPFAALGADPTTSWDGLILQAGTAGNQPAVYVDEVDLLAFPCNCRRGGRAWSRYRSPFSPTASSPAASALGRRQCRRIPE
jgi:hypothetical protein